MSTRKGRERSRIRAAMSAPLRVDGRTIGVLNVSSDKPGVEFKDDDLARLVDIADQISGILDRAIRVARRERDAVELRARREIEIAFSRKGLELTERLRMVAGRLAELLEADAVQVHLADESLDRFRTVSSAGRYGQEGELPLHLFIHSQSDSFPAKTSIDPVRRLGLVIWQATEQHKMAEWIDSLSLGALM